MSVFVCMAVYGCVWLCVCIFFFSFHRKCWRLWIPTSRRYMRAPPQVALRRLWQRRRATRFLRWQSLRTTEQLSLRRLELLERWISNARREASWFASELKRWPPKLTFLFATRRLSVGLLAPSMFFVYALCIFVYVLCIVVLSLCIFF